jgi:phosphatidylinositol alpha-1,6-mannosyltransferase
MPTVNTKGKPISIKELPNALIITRNLPPLVGGMERLVWHIVDELSQEYRVHVIGPAGCGDYLPRGVTVNEVPLKPFFLYLLHTKVAALWQALRRRPHLVLAGSGLTAPFAWIVARLFGANCVVYLHGLDIEARHPLYRLFWRPFFRYCDRVLVNSHFTQQLAYGAGISHESTTILHPGVELPDMRDAARQRTEFRNRHDLKDSPVMLYVGRITARKGFAVFAGEILPRIIEGQPDAKLLLIGDEPEYALKHRGGERQRAMDALAANHLSNRLIILTGADDNTLRSAYFASDVLVFPVQERLHDHEGFGMVAIEAAAHGLPTVAFAVGGVTDAIADNVSGKLIAADDNNAFSQAVIDLLNNASSEGMEDITTFAARFAWSLFGQRLRFLCRSVRGD